METATITGFMPSKFGTKVLLNDKEIQYLPEGVKVVSGMTIKFNRHKAGVEVTTMTGKKFTPKADGIHDVIIGIDASKALITHTEGVRAKFANSDMSEFE